MSQIEIEEETDWIPVTRINDITTIFVIGAAEESFYIALLIFSVLYSIRLLKS